MDVAHIQTIVSPREMIWPAAPSLAEPFQTARENYRGNLEQEEGRLITVQSRRGDAEHQLVQEGTHEEDDDQSRERAPAFRRWE